MHLFWVHLEFLLPSLTEIPDVCMQRYAWRGGFSVQKWRFYTVGGTRIIAHATPCMVNMKMESRCQRRGFKWKMKDRNPDSSVEKP